MLNPTKKMTLLSLRLLPLLRILNVASMLLGNLKRTPVQRTCHPFSRKVMPILQPGQYLAQHYSRLALTKPKCSRSSSSTMDSLVPDRRLHMARPRHHMGSK